MEDMRRMDQGTRQLTIICRRDDSAEEIGGLD